MLELDSVVGHLAGIGGLAVRVEKSPMYLMSENLDVLKVYL